jgi:hypothetical protein
METQIRIQNHGVFRPLDLVSNSIYFIAVARHNIAYWPHKRRYGFWFRTASPQSGSGGDVLNPLINETTQPVEEDHYILRKCSKFMELKLKMLNLGEVMECNE